mgnify:CR=1 FL=1
MFYKKMIMREKMEYGYQKIVEMSFEKTEEIVRKNLAENGFGVLTEISVDKAMKEKLNKNFRRYKILGACHPPSAFDALSEELEVGLLLPCNVTIWENKNKTITITAIDAEKILNITGNKKLHRLSLEVNNSLKKALDSM